MLCSTWRIFAPWDSQAWGWDGATNSGMKWHWLQCMCWWVLYLVPLAATRSRLSGSNHCWLAWGRAVRRDKSDLFCNRALTVSTITYNICLVSGCKVTDSSGDYTALRTDGKTSIINNYCNKCCIEVITNLTSQRRERTESNFNEMQVYTIIIFSWFYVTGPGNRFQTG